MIFDTSQLLRDLHPSKSATNLPWPGVAAPAPGGAPAARVVQVVQGAPPAVGSLVLSSPAMKQWSSLDVEKPMLKGLGASILMSMSRKSLPSILQPADLRF